MKTFVAAVLLAVVSIHPATAATRQWSGAVNNLWSVGGNWVGGVAPVNGDDLVFPTVAQNPSVNDIVGLALQSVTITAHTNQINGNGVTLSGGITKTTCCGLTIVNVPLTLAASQSVTGGRYTFGQAIDLNGHTLTLSTGDNTTLAGSVTGTGDVIFDGVSLTVSGPLSFNGTLDLRAGTAALNSTVAGPTIAANATITGNGSLAAATLTNTTLSPGSNITLKAIFSTGPFSMTGGTARFELNTATPGTGHDQLVVNGSVTLNNPTLDVQLPNGLPPAGTSFVIIDNDGVDPVVGTFSGLAQGATFNIAGVQFQISYIGGTGNDVVLTVVSSPKAWTGAVNDLWSVGGNWNDGVPPVNGDALVFPVGALNNPVTNDIAGLTLQSVTFQTNTLQLNGNAITLTGGLTKTSCCALVLWNTPIALGASITISDAGRFDFAQPIALNGFTLTITPSSTRISQPITGAGTLNLGSGTIFINSTVSAPTIANATILGGTGTIGTATLTNATITPGNVPGPGLAIFHTGNLSLTGGAARFEILNTNPGSGHDQIAVIGTVTLNAPALVLPPASAPAPGNSFVIIDNDGVDPVVGTFSGQPEGSAITASGGRAFRVTYVGGTGNDVVLIALATTTVTLTNSGVPQNIGDPVTVTAHVAPTFGTPTGTVTFTDNGNPIGTIALDGNGEASLTFNATAGSHSIVANYNGDATYAPASSAPFTFALAALAGVPTLSPFLLAALAALLAYVALRGTR
jgi:hypothetical protein